MRLNPYKQSFTHSCLVACFLMLLYIRKGVRIEEKLEQEVYLEGTKRTNRLYVVGITKEISKRFKAEIEIFVDNKYFTEVLKEFFTGQKDISVYQQKITLNFLLKLLKVTPLVCHVDIYSLGERFHQSHFILLERISGKKIVVIDPACGKRRYFSLMKLEEAIISFKRHLKMCPLLFSLS